MNQSNLNCDSTQLIPRHCFEHLYVEVTPNPLGRLGHQFHNILSGILLAHAFGGQCLKPIFTGNSSCWNDVIGFTGSHICNDLSDTNYSTLSGIEGTDVTFASLKLYFDILSNSSSGPLLIKLQPDQFAGCLMKLLPFSLPELRQASSFELKVVSRPEIAIHIRRGDVTPVYASSLYTNLDSYLFAFNAVSHFLPLHWPVRIYSEGRIEDFESLAFCITRDSGRQVFYCLEENMFSVDSVSDFTQMIGSGALICSYSTYAYCAFYFSASLGSRFFIADSRSNTSEGLLQLEVFRSIGVNIIQLNN